MKFKQKCIGFHAEDLDNPVCTYYGMSTGRCLFSMGSNLCKDIEEERLMAHMKDQRLWLDDLTTYGISPQRFANYRMAEVFANKVEAAIADGGWGFQEACTTHWNEVKEGVAKELASESLGIAVSPDVEEVKNILTLHWKYSEEFLAWLD